MNLYCQIITSPLSTLRSRQKNNHLYEVAAEQNEHKLDGKTLGFKLRRQHNALRIGSQMIDCMCFRITTSHCFDFFQRISRSTEFYGFPKINAENYFKTCMINQRSNLIRFKQTQQFTIQMIPGFQDLIILSYFEMQTVDQIQYISQLFEKKQHELAITQISTLINNYPNNSSLYSNRAVFNSELGNNQQAQADIKYALQCNNMNYLAYFNLFSINLNSNQQNQALQALYCSLSVLYLLRAKCNKSIEDVNRAIFYANNNIQARVLKGLLLLESGWFDLSEKEFLQARQIDPTNPLLIQLAAIAQSKLHLVSIECKLKTNSYTYLQQISKIQLKGTIKLKYDSNLQEEIQKKIQQFNIIYNEISSRNEGTVKRVKRQYKQFKMGGHILTYMLNDLRASQRSSEGTFTPVAILDDQDYFSSRLSAFLSNRSEALLQFKIYSIEEAQEENGNTFKSNRATSGGLTISQIEEQDDEIESQVIQ